MSLSFSGMKETNNLLGECCSELSVQWFRRVHEALIRCEGQILVSFHSTVEPESGAESSHCVSGASAPILRGFFICPWCAGLYLRTVLGHSMMGPPGGLEARNRC